VPAQLAVQDAPADVVDVQWAEVDGVAADAADAPDVLNVSDISDISDSVAIKDTGDIPDTLAPSADADGAAGACLNAGAKSCDDGSACTADSCDSKKGCVNNVLPDNTQCVACGRPLSQRRERGNILQFKPLSAVYPPSPRSGRGGAA